MAISPPSTRGVPIMCLSLHHLPDPAAALAEARRVLSPSGTLVVIDFAPHQDETMLRLADVVVITKGDVVSQAEREVFAFRVRQVNPRATVLFVSGLTGQGADALALCIQAAPETADLDGAQLRFTMVPFILHFKGVSGSTGKARSQFTVNKYCDYLSFIFHFGMDNGFTTVNPLKNWKKPKVQPWDLKLTLEDAKKIMGFFDPPLPLVSTLVID